MIIDCLVAAGCGILYGKAIGNLFWNKNLTRGEQTKLFLFSLLNGCLTFAYFYIKHKS